ncbi:MAG: hypothetical protein ABI851_16030 [Saprospiraceae bacterium]
MYSENYFKDLEPSEIKRRLVDNADRIEEGEYFAPLSEEELEAERQIYTEKSIESAIINEELDKIKQEFKLKLKPLEIEIAIRLQRLRTKGESRKGNLYYMADQESGFMEIFNEAGDLIEKRRLRPDEKAKTLKFQIASNS